MVAKMELVRRTRGMELMPDFAGMSNYTGTIDDGIEQALRGKPHTLAAQHSAMHFCGYFYFENDAFHEEVMRYGEHVDTISAKTLPELMESVNEMYGAE